MKTAMTILFVSMMALVLYISNDLRNERIRISNQMKELSTSLTITEHFLERKYDNEWLNYRNFMEEVLNDTEEPWETLWGHWAVKQFKAGVLNDAMRKVQRDRPH